MKDYKTAWIVAYFGILLLLLGSCSTSRKLDPDPNPESKHVPPATLAMPTGEEMCNKYLTSADVAFFMRVHNRAGCMSDLNYRRMMRGDDGQK